MTDCKRCGKPQGFGHRCRGTGTSAEPTTKEIERWLRETRSGGLVDVTLGRRIATALLARHEASGTVVREIVDDLRERAETCPGDDVVTAAARASVQHAALYIERRWGKPSTPPNLADERCPWCKPGEDVCPRHPMSDDEREAADVPAHEANRAALVRADALLMTLRRFLMHADLPKNLAAESYVLDIDAYFAMRHKNTSPRPAEDQDEKYVTCPSCGYQRSTGFSKRCPRPHCKG